MTRFYFFLLFFISFLLSSAQIPPGYYDDASGLTGNALKQALHNIIKDHQQETYDELWEDFFYTDQKPNGKVWDIYSDNPGGTPPYQYTFFDDQCGNYGGEGDCYNREHSFPKSWFGGEVYPMNSDLFHLYPTDGYVNGIRSNDPYGEVSNPDWTSENGGKSGPCSYPGYTGNAFEPIDEYKGDLARTYFYMATRYLGEDSGWPGSDMVNGSQMKPWAQNMLKGWHFADPVSQKEIDRNNAVYLIQENRNPFIDHPEFFNLIWGTVGLTEPDTELTGNFSISPNPARDRTHLYTSEAKQITAILIISVHGTAFNAEVNPSGEIDLSGLRAGFYIIDVTFFDGKHGYNQLVIY